MNILSYVSYFQDFQRRALHEVLSHLVQYLPALLIRKSTFDVFPLMEDTHLRIDLNEAKLHGSK